jgi:hypothetical protein
MNVKSSHFPMIVQIFLILTPRQLKEGQTIEKALLF